MIFIDLICWQHFLLVSKPFCYFVPSAWTQSKPCFDLRKLDRGIFFPNPLRKQGLTNNFLTCSNLLHNQMLAYCQISKFFPLTHIMYLSSSSWCSKPACKQSCKSTKIIRLNLLPLGFSQHPTSQNRLVWYQSNYEIRWDDVLWKSNTLLNFVKKVKGSASKMFLYHLSIVFPAAASPNMYMAGLVNLNNFVLSFKVSELLCSLLIDVIKWKYNYDL